MPNNIKHWPAKGNAYYAGLNFPITEDLAPFIDYNGNGIYDPENGDFPHIKGDKAMFWVINDAGQHFYSNAPEAYWLNVQINCMAYAYNNPNFHLNNTTFYDYKVVKKTYGDYKDFYFSLFFDPTIGSYTDDYIGCDTTQNIAYVYNANAVDGIYGENPPVAAIKMLGNSQNLRLSSFTNGGDMLGCGMQSIDLNPGAIRNMQLGYDMCGFDYYYGGSGTQNSTYSTNQKTKFLFSGNPCACDSTGNWTERNPNPFACPSTPLAPSDKRMLLNTGPFTLNYNNPVEISFAVTAFETENYTGCVDTDTFLVPEMVKLQTHYTNHLKNGNNYDIELPNSIQAISSAKWNIAPNPASHYFSIAGDEIQNLQSIEIFSLEGKLVLTMENPTTIISTASLSTGSYLVKINTEASFSVHKIIILK